MVDLDPWDIPEKPSEPATASTKLTIARESWRGLSRGQAIRITRDAGHPRLAGKVVEFLCHRHVIGQRTGWVDVYLKGKTPGIYAVAEHEVRRLR